MHKAQIKMAWFQYCLPFHKKDINLINLVDALVTLLVKWIVKTMEPLKSYLHMILRYHLSQFQPCAQ